MPSRRLLPGRSGISRWWSSTTSTNPGPSPLGETSHWPWAFEVASSRKGARAMNSRQCTSSVPSSLASAPLLGSPTRVRSSASVVTVFWNALMVSSGPVAPAPAV